MLLGEFEKDSSEPYILFYNPNPKVMNRELMLKKDGTWGRTTLIEK